MLLVHETMVVIRTTVDENQVGYITLFSGHCRLGEARNKSDNILNYTMIYSGEAFSLILPERALYFEKKKSKLQGSEDYRNSRNVTQKCWYIQRDMLNCRK